MRSFIYKYNRNFKSLTRNLRHKQTDTERLLWSKLRDRQLGEYKFHRQFPIGKYILDFYCSEKKLAIEIDGGQHNTPIQIGYDEKRTMNLKNQGIKLLRFWDNEVFTNLEGVLEKILTELQK